MHWSLSICPYRPLTCQINKPYGRASAKSRGGTGEGGREEDGGWRGEKERERAREREEGGGGKGSWGRRREHVTMIGRDAGDLRRVKSDQRDSESLDGPKASRE